MESHMTTRFEDLPNELFYILFSYFDIIKLYEKFSGLNLRFKNLLKSNCCHCLCVESKIDRDMINSFAKNIKSIHIKTTDSFISLRPFFDSLSVLVLEKITEEYVNELPFLVHLEHLEIKKFPDKRPSKKLIKYLASSTQLHYLSLPHWHSETGNYIPSSLRSIRILRIRNQNEFTNLLGHLPNVVCLNFYDSGVQQCSLISDILPNIRHNVINFHLHLTNGFTHSQLDFYLAHMSNIKSFHFSTSPCLVYNSQRGPYGTLDAIASITLNRLSKLERFSCFVRFEFRSNELFDIKKVDTIYHQNYSVVIKNNIQNFKSIWRRT